ncbi:MAG: DNA translocase FtsK 4TM domain-containing protein, partial [Alphaproteobacteria bacterium]|nr:DNA translocase FtsK 4TM domain-containing protein [Alphaproteobacteria bacterium]
MAKSAPFLARGLGRRVSRQVNSWSEMVAAGKRRLLEGLGSALVLVSFLLALALLTYNPADPSLDTASNTPATNFLGRDGAILADLLIQGIGMAAFLIPLILLGWAFRLLLQRTLRRMPRRLATIVPALALAAFACAVLRAAPLPTPAGVGGIVGWTLLRGAAALGAGGIALPLAMGAAALVALLLLSIMGLSRGDWRDIGSGAGRGAARLALVSGQGARVGTAAALGFGRHVVTSWRAAYRARRATPASVRALGPAQPLPWTPQAAAQARREPHFPTPRPQAATVASAAPAADEGGATGRLVRLVLPGTRSVSSGRRAEQERQPVLDLGGQPILPPIDLLTRPP